MAGNDTKKGKAHGKLINEMVSAWLSCKWGIRITAGSSLALHIILLLVADIRRYNVWPGWRLLLWVAYQGLDIAGGYALGHLSLDSCCGDDEAATESEQLLVAFWAPFLLLHLGGPDNISAYSLDDDKLGWRKAFRGFSTVLQALFVVFSKIWLADDAGLLRPASIIMVVVGTLRFTENVVAVVQALLRKTSDDSSDEKTPPTSILFDSSIQMDSAKSKKRYGFLTKEWKEFLEAVEEDATKIYDVLYTKAGQVHTWRGYFLRFLSPLATAVAFALFGLYPKDRVQQVDVIITYVLLSAALLLDVVWLVAALGSTSAKKFFEDKPGFWFHFHHEIQCRGWWQCLNRITELLHPWRLLGIGPSCYGSCSGSIGRYDLVQECTRASGMGVARRLWIHGQQDAVVWSDYRSWKCLSPLRGDVKNLLFERVQKRLRDTISGKADAYTMPDIRERWGQEAVQRRKQKFPWANNLVKFFGREFQEDILLWHIGTTIYLCSNNHKQCIIMDADDAEKTKLLVKAIEVVSEYLMFLVAARPHMLPDPPLRNLYEVTEKALQNLYKKKKKAAYDDDLCCDCESRNKKKLAQALRDKHDKLKSSDSTRLVSYAAELAIQLQEVDASRLQDVVELVFDVWVDKLLYAAIRCSRESHARQLSCGGEFITITWIAAEYAGVFKIGETGNGTTPTPTTTGDDDTPPSPDPSDNDIIEPPKCQDEEAGCCYPKENETCHCHKDPFEPVCLDTCCMEDYYCSTQDDYYFG
ncbi:unnamed protein product [Urochloa humidicola]